MNTHTIPPKIIINYLTRTQLHRWLLCITEHAHNSTDDCYQQRNTHTMPRAIIINYWKRTQFHRHSHLSTEYDHNSNSNHIKLL